MTASARAHLRPVPRRDDDAVLSIRERLTVGEVGGFCAAVLAALARGVRAVTVDMHDASATDAVGLAALLQGHRLAGQAGVRFTVAACPRVARQLVDARIVDELDVMRAGGPARSATYRLEPAAGVALIATAGRVTLRQPRLDDVPTFRAWGADGFVEQMVGSHLLYRCRYLDADDAGLLGVIAHDPRALTAVIDSSLGDGRPLGFVRLHEIDLVAGFGFLETVAVEPRALRRGIGIEASRLLIAYAMDALALRRVEAKVFAYNVLSINALRRNGFQEEGVLREARLYEQQAWNILVFSLLEREMRRERGAEAYPSFALFAEPEDRPA